MEFDTDTQAMAAIIQALDRSNAIIEFDPDGQILQANDIFLQLMGYTLEELRGQHHRILVEPDHAASADYQRFWQRLRAGEFIAGEFLRIGRDGREVWLQATYNPVLSPEGQPEKVVKIATDTTARKLEVAHQAGMVTALDQSMAVVTFAPDGTVESANERFLMLTGYPAGAVIGQHHRLFVDPAEAASPAYRQFWAQLAAGESKRGRFERRTHSGESLWLEATYAPVRDPKGRVIRVIKFAYDVTGQVEQSEALELALAEAREAERVRQELDRTVQEMSTPVTPIWEGILLLPLVGVLDSMRTSDIMNKSLAMISEMRAKVFVLDISGVPTVDTAVANQLIKITKATRLMGCEAIISGLSPAIARTIVELGVHVEEIRTTATLRDAFEQALGMVGATIGVGQAGPALSARD